LRKTFGHMAQGSLDLLLWCNHEYMWFKIKTEMCLAFV
jgi:hypothetical protein